MLFCILNLPRGSVASSVTQVRALKILSFRVKSVSKFSSKYGVKSCLHLVRRNKDAALVSVTLRPTSKRSVFVCILVHVAAVERGKTSVKCTKKTKGVLFYLSNQEYTALCLPKACKYLDRVTIHS